MPRASISNLIVWEARAFYDFIRRGEMTLQSAKAQILPTPGERKWLAPGAILYREKVWCALKALAGKRHGSAL